MKSNPLAMPLRALLTVTGFLLLGSGQAQINNAVKGGVILGTIYGLSKLKHGEKQAKDYPPSDIQDISGTWVGTVSDPGSSWYYQVSLIRTGPNTYTGLDSFRLEEKKNNAAIPIGFNVKQTLTGSFTNGVFVYSGVQNIDNPNFPLLMEQLRLVRDKDSSAMVNNNASQPTRKFYLRRATMSPDPGLTKVIDAKNAVIAANTITASSLEIESITYNSSNNTSVLRYNDHGQMNIKLRNHAGKALDNIQISVATTEPVNGLIGFDRFASTVNLAGNSENNFSGPISTNFSVPHDSVHFTMTFKYDAFSVQQQFALATEPYFKTNDVVVPAYTTSRLQAVSGYYGYLNAPWSDVTRQLDALVTGGDKMATMWKAVFLSMGYGGYKIDEEQGYALGKTCIRAVEEKAKNCDGEALFLMFYACQMGLEGESARALAINFLEKSAMAGFKPAVYDYALQFTQHKDYASAFKYLEKSYEMGVKKAAEVIGLMYERGLGIANDDDTAIAWYKTGMAFGDPEAAMCYAQLVAKGYGSNPPDINKALTLTNGAAAKNCTDAMIFNGKIFLDGKQGVARSIPTAIKWFKAGADQGDRQAMLALGETYLTDGPGIVKDERMGLFWIKRAAELGSPKAMLVLAKFYNEGTTVEKNIVIARYWYNQAVLSGYANPDATGLNAGAESFMNFWKYADFSPSYIYVNEYGEKVADGDDGLINGFASGIFGAMGAYYGNHQQLIDGVEFICKKGGYKIYGGMVSSSYVSNLWLKQGQTIHIRTYGIISTGMFSGPANADGLGPNWPEYRIIKDIPCSAVMGAVKDAKWTFIGQNAFYTAPKEGPLVLALNAVDYRNYKGYFDLVIQVPEN